MEESKISYVVIDSSQMEYVTIKPEKLYEQEYWRNSRAIEPYFKVLVEKKDLLEMFKQEANFKPDKIKNSASYIYLVLCNAKLAEIKYRLHTVVLIGENEPNSRQVFQISTKEFIWSSLNFSLFDENGDNLQVETIKWI